MSRHLLLALFVSCCAGVVAPPALATPPSNDARATPQELGQLPALVQGTTVEATLDEDEPLPGCGPIKNSVWFSFTTPASRDLLVALDAAGDLDARLEVFVRQRSQLISVSCLPTDSRGRATLDLDATAGTPYLVRVAALDPSVDDAFTLRVAQPEEAAQPPGTPLPAAGTSGELGRFTDPDDTWSTRMREGRTYRINLVTVGGGCLQAALHAEGEFRQRPERTLSCDDHAVFAAPKTGRYTIHLVAPRASRAVLPYRLRVGPAERDDSAPGIVLPDDRRARGELRGDELDALDLYRFTLARRSDVTVELRTVRELDLRLLSAGGRRLACSCGPAGFKELTRRLEPGRYFVAVRARDGARGSYVLSRLARTITHATMLADGKRSTDVAPGEMVDLTLRVRPDVAGRATLVVERFDPLAGWLFHSRHHPHVSSDGATMVFRPPAVGRWRVTGSYDGTRKSSPSNGGTAEFNVLEPLE